MFCIHIFIQNSKEKKNLSSTKDRGENGSRIGREIVANKKLRNVSAGIII